MTRRSVFNLQFWREYLVDARRFTRDKRARKGVLMRSLFLLFVASYIGYYVALLGSLHDPATIAVVLVVVMLIGVVVGAVRYSHYREARRQLSADIASAPAITTVSLQHTAHGIAAITERALGELWLKSNKLAEGQTVLTRQIQIQALKSAGVWDEMSFEARAWTMRPDGEWPDELIARVLSRAEILHTLLWVLGLAKALRPIESVGEPLNFRRLARALRKPASGIRPSWDLRLERNRTNEYYLRCFAERIHRGELVPESDAQKAAVHEWITDIASGELSDRLAGAATVGELESPKLYQIGLSSACRLHTLTLVMQALDGRDIQTDLSALAYGSFGMHQD